MRTLTAATVSSLALVAFALAGCRADPGDPEYPDYPSLGGGADGLPQGPDPYEEGEARLSLGAFYEGESSDLAEVDDLNVFYYIYDSTYSQDTDEQDVVEGRVSDVLEMAGLGWFGGGIHPSGTANLSEWTTLNVSFKSRDETLGDFSLVFQSGGDFSVNASSYGYAADGEWHHLMIPMSDFTDQGFIAAAAESYFMMLGEGVSDGDELRIDNLYFTAE